MGDEISSGTFTREQRARYRAKVRRCLDVFERMLSEHQFDTDQALTGLEIELNLVGSDWMPAMRNAEVLHRIADPAFQTELGRYNIELNVPPRALTGDSARELEAALRASLDHAEAMANEAGSEIIMIGILPTLTADHLDGDWMSANPRYAALDDAVFAARREDLELDIVGEESLRMDADTIAPESACTSVQLHSQVAPGEFAQYWNAAQTLAGPQLALGANSPFLFGKRLWAETRVELFLQATDTRSPELKNQGVRPPVFFGERWITSIFDLFEENVRYFPALLPETTDEDPEAVLASGQAPRLQELRLHNGTVYRWNRPVYDTVDGRAHVRVENRVLPAGPTVVDVLANAAFYHGALEMLAHDERPVWTKMSFDAAHANFLSGARHGVEAQFYWPGFGEVSWDELLLRHLLPLAHAGLERRGVSAPVRERYLGIVEARCKTRRNGAWWQSETVAALERRGASRSEALTGMLRLYSAGMHSNEPVHTWDVPG
ncbi:glutamate--cysteine ligase [Nakamurella flavida]|uniref:Glutamate--cysteine ligase n=1 Tax=Nakamurella flavida TaxID=363630 RepID=A0A938YLZ5_9ACTN|nr:glutamate--cysteine ligase [Nakamurella flavida]MBM9478462.1 glutamate--cysteine ligase [Nakamurella flavida]MDP9777712.1 gamma-glutamyl:cysteine ligase YbdK (ATP-grasp superfamily) [Nakamurella flavida]